MTKSRIGTDEVAQLLGAMVAIPSINPAFQKSELPTEWFGEAKLADFIAGWLRNEGIEVRMEELLAAEILEIKTVEVAGADRVIRQVERVPENRQPRHQPRRQGWQATSILVNFSEVLFQKRPVNRLRQPHQEDELINANKSLRS